MLAEIAQRDAGGSASRTSRLHRLGQQHLAAVAGVRDARRAVDVVADVVGAGGGGAEARFAGVQAHAHADHRLSGKTWAASARCAATTAATAAVARWNT